MNGKLFSNVVCYVSLVVVLVVLQGLAWASVITTGDVDPGGAATQPDPWAVRDNLYVGKSVSGTLNITDGGVVYNSHGYLGNSSDSIGAATVSGANSLWNSSGVLSVGRYGSGTLNVGAGVVVSNTDDGYIGRFLVQQGR